MINDLESRQTGNPVRVDSRATKVALVRHGETDWNIREIIQGQSDIPLNQTGITQAKQVAAWLGEYVSWDCLYTSPLIRALHTAEKVSATVHLCPIIREDLKERDFGALEGLTSAERDARFPTRREDESSVPGLEIRPKFRERVVSSFESIIREAAGENIIIVSHGGWINQLLSHLSKGTIGSGVTPVRNGSICLIQKGEADQWDLSIINFCGHLS